MKNRLVLILFHCFILLFQACISTKPTTYFNNSTDTTFITKSNSSNGSNSDYIIQKNDILSISITSLNQEASAIFNTLNNYVFTSSGSAGSRIQSSGYLVGEDGVIQLPLLGLVKAEGETIVSLKANITAIIKSQHLLLDPIVTIRHTNFEVTVIGEVGHPSVISVPNEQISFLKALGLAGDITIYGRKDNVLLIRENGKTKEIKYVNLNSKNFLNSSYYYLKPNDIIYVEANKNKVASVASGTRLLPVFLSGLSVVILVVDRVLFK